MGYSMPWSARASSDGRIVSPRALAVFRLIIVNPVQEAIVWTLHELGAVPRPASGRHAALR